MDDLITFLRAQLDEDERIARGADPGPWKSESLGRHDQAAIKLAAPTSLIQFDGSRAAANGMHVIRHDPARVLREIDTKRQLLARYEQAASEYAADSRAYDYESEIGRERTRVLGEAVRLAALSYSDRPGFREEWAP